MKFVNILKNIFVNKFWMKLIALILATLVVILFNV